MKATIVSFCVRVYFYIRRLILRPQSGYHEFRTYRAAMQFLRDHESEGAKMVAWPYGNRGQCVVFIPQGNRKR